MSHCSSRLGTLVTAASALLFTHTALSHPIGCGHGVVEASVARGPGGVIMESSFEYDQHGEEPGNDAWFTAQRIPQVVRSQSFLRSDLNPNPQLERFWDHRYQGVFVEYSGGVSASDKDYYVIHASQGDVIGLVVERAFSGSTVNLDVAMWHETEVEDAPDQGVANNDGFEVTSRYRFNTPLPRTSSSQVNEGSAAIAYVAPQSGDYYIRISGNRSGSYKFRLVATRARAEYDLSLFSPTEAPADLSVPTSIRLHDDIDSIAAFRLLGGLPSTPPITGMTTLAHAYAMSNLPAGEYDDFKDDVLAVIRQNLEALQALDPRVHVNVVWDTSSGNPFLGTFVSPLNMYVGSYGLVGNQINVAFCGDGDDFGMPTLGGLAEGGSVGGYEGGIAWVGVADMADSMSVLRDEFLDDPSVVPNNQRRRALAIMLGNIATHEIGHVLGVWHTDENGSDQSVMQAGLSINAAMELGDNDIFEGGRSLGGNGGDDIDVGFLNDQKYQSGPNEPNLQRINPTASIAAAPLIEHLWVDGQRPQTHVPNIFSDINQAIDLTSPYTGQEIIVQDGYETPFAAINTRGQVPYIRTQAGSILERHSPMVTVRKGGANSVIVSEKLYEMENMPELAFYHPIPGYFGMSLYRRVRVPTIGTVENGYIDTREDFARIDENFGFYSIGSFGDTVFRISGDAEFNNIAFTGALASGPGVIEHTAGHLTLNYCRFTQGRVSQSGRDGGVILQTGGTLEINDCEFRDNRATADGGAIHSTGGDLYINRTSFRNNRAEGAGGAIYRDTAQGTEGKFRVYNSEFFENSAATGAAIVYNDANSPGIEGWVLHNTFARNLADATTSVVHSDVLGVLTLDFNIFWDNYVGASSDVQFTGAAAGALNMPSNIIQDGVTLNDPNLISSRAGDLRLFGVSGSAYEALDAAFPMGYPDDIGDLDIRRAPRTQSSALHGVDRRSYGAHESQIVLVDANDRVSDASFPDQHTTIASALAATNELSGVVSIDSIGSNSGFLSEGVFLFDSRVALVGGWTPGDPRASLGNLTGPDPGPVIVIVGSSPATHVLGQDDGYPYYSTRSPHLAAGLSNLVISNQRPITGGTLGGGVASNSFGPLFVTHTLFDDCAAEQGGAAFLDGSTWFRDVVFRDNEASDGGAIYHRRVKNFNGITAGERGSDFIMNSAPTLEIIESVFLSNMAFSDGGDLYNTNGSVVMDRVISHDARAINAGAHLYSGPEFPYETDARVSQTNTFVAGAVGESVARLIDSESLDPDSRSIFEFVNTTYRDSASTGMSSNQTLAIDLNSPTSNSDVVVANTIFQGNTGAGNVPTNPAVDPIYSITDLVAEANATNEFNVDTVLSTAALPAVAALANNAGYDDYAAYYDQWFRIDATDSAADAGSVGLFFALHWFEHDVNQSPRVTDLPGVPETIPGSTVDVGAFEAQPCFGDLDGDGDRDSTDLADLLAQWGTPCPCSGDLDGDGDVDSDDLSAILGVLYVPCP